jgi:hypothetical protein
MQKKEKSKKKILLLHLQDKTEQPENVKTVNKTSHSLQVQGCQIFHGAQTGKNVPNVHKKYQMVIKYPKRP